MTARIATASDPATLRSAYGRAALLGVAAGVLVGVLAGCAVGLMMGYPSVIPLFSVQYAAFAGAASGVVAGGTALVLVASRAFASRSRRFRVVLCAIAAGTGALLLGAGVLALVPAAQLWWALLIAAPVAAIALALSAWAERRALRVAAPPQRSHLTPTGPLAVVLGGAAALPMFGATVSLLREQLHYLCSFGEPGTEAAGWNCPDGISYLGAGIVLGGITALLIVNGLLAVVLVRGARTARILLTLLAAAALATGLAGTWMASSSYVWALPDGITGTDYWVAAVLPAAAVAASSAAIALGSLALAGRAALVLGGVAAAGLLAATVLQPGLGISTLPAIGLLLAAAARAAAAPRAA